MGLESKLGLLGVTTRLDKSLNQSPQGNLEKIGYTSSNRPPRNCCKVPGKYLIGHVLGGQNEGSTRMPSSILHNQIPHSLLFPDQPLYFLSPRVFGCTCFVHILTPGQDKLSAKATKCIFLGYSRFQKGYRCYSDSSLLSLRWCHLLWGLTILLNL